MAKKLKASKNKDKSGKEREIVSRWESIKRGKKIVKVTFPSKYPAGKKRNSGSSRRGKQIFFPRQKG